MSPDDAIVRSSPTPCHAAAPVWLSRHVHLCKLGERFIVLNVARDEYLCVEGVAAAHLSEIVAEWAELVSRPGSAVELQLNAEITHLVAQGILTTSATDARDVPIGWFGPSTADRALDGNYPSKTCFQAGHIVCFLWSLTSTAFTLRFRSLQFALNSLANCKTGAETEFSIERLADLIAIFRRLRSFSFAGHRRCLLHALALTKFLAHYGIHASFVMGVKVEPWAAHSWVELGNYVLDGTPEQARFYHRILVI
jgi:hypothetical protein